MPMMLARLGQALYWVVVIAMPLLGSATAAERQPHITGIYSDLEYNREAGDLLGTELFIVLGPKGYEAFVQVSEGSPGPSAVVPVKVERDHISFSAPEPSLGAGTYEGRISPNSFIGTRTGVAGGQTVTKPVRLLRKNSYWQ
ncbi:MAG TPA: hypothetical protein VEU95_03735 [Micropepsaceae bacterium]|nr:hypothetical protein [Micropepsaceae bacterium]